MSKKLELIGLLFLIIGVFLLIISIKCLVDYLKIESKAICEIGVVDKLYQVNDETYIDIFLCGNYKKINIKVQNTNYKNKDSLVLWRTPSKVFIKKELFDQLIVNFIITILFTLIGLVLFFKSNVLVKQDRDGVLVLENMHH